MKKKIVLLPAHQLAGESSDSLLDFFSVAMSKGKTSPPNHENVLVAVAAAAAAAALHRSCDRPNDGASGRNLSL